MIDMVGSWSMRQSPGLGEIDLIQQIHQVMTGSASGPDTTRYRPPEWTMHSVAVGAVIV